MIEPYNVLLKINNKQLKYIQNININHRHKSARVVN